MADQQNEEKKQWDVVLPGEDYVLQQWLVRNGSAVQPGDKLATAVQKGAATSSSTEPPAAADVRHKRPKKRKRVPDAASKETAATITPATTKPVVKKPSAHLPPQTQDVMTIVAPAAGVLRIEQSPLNLKIASIEPCQHPAIMGGLCAVCGASMGPQHSQSAFTLTTAKQYSSRNMSQVTVSGGITMTISEAEAQQMSKQTSNRLLEQQKLSLVLDLDHTLVHATADVRAREHSDRRSDIRTLILPVMVEPPQTHWMQHYVKLRPHVKEFLTQAQSLYEISVYTAGTRMYAEHVCMLLSRDMVGANLDEMELQQLRHGVMCAEYEMANKNANAERKKAAAAGDGVDSSGNIEASTKDDDSAKDTPEKSQEHKADEKKEATNGETSSATDDKKDSKKKSVSFGEPPKESKTDEMTFEVLETLKKELQEAEEVEQKALELRQQVFGSRIVSRTDVGDLGRDVKSLERIFPGGGSMALIVDDREDVWANAQDNSKTSGEPPENLLLIRPYHWKPFLGFADVNNAAGEDISGESTTTEDEDDCALLWTLDILKRMHKRFYDAIEETGNRDITVPPLLREMRQEVLEGCTLVFSGLIPLHHQIRTSQFPRPAVVRYGESLGARVSLDCDVLLLLKSRILCMRCLFCSTLPSHLH